MTALGQKQTKAASLRMSALGHQWTSWLAPALDASTAYEEALQLYRPLAEAGYSKAHCCGYRVGAAFPRPLARAAISPASRRDLEKVGKKPDLR